jgi:hypothetical protein
MIDRYARDALACYGRLRQLSPADARAELELFDHLLVIAGRPVDETDRSRQERRFRSGAAAVWWRRWPAASQL